jgi:hypothetical protein
LQSRELRCLNEQRSLSAWAGAQSRDISTFLVPEDIKKTLEWIAAVPANALERVEFRGVNLWSVCVNELRLRWDEVDISNLSDAQEGDLRNLYVAYVRVAVASERLIGQWKPDLTVLSSIHDPIAHAYLLQAKLAGIDAAVCSYQAEEELVVFESLASKESYATPLALEGITGMRSDPRTWGPEVTAVVHEVLTYLGYPPDRLV